ncbi:MAG TPA: hypothetical protein VFD48_00330 [Pyrinomonadaceae bacterium]|nr:hypothetical protein [Pyrinomonadaceae bacterium]
MSTELVKLNAEEAAALDRIDAELKAAPATGPGVAAASTDLCKKYHTLKGPLQILVKLLRKIPGFGGKAADALEFLMSIADSFCPV